MFSVEQSADSSLGGLTPKQCQVLDLLIQHKTSKEISRLLGISPHTVDQRILLARAKLNVATRNETAQAYRRLLAERDKTSSPDIYQQSVYGSSDMAEPEQWAQVLEREATDDDVRTGLPAEPDRIRIPPRPRADLLPGGTVRAYHHVLPEAFDGRGGTLLRLGAIVAIAMCMTLLILGGMAIYTELVHMLDS
ncbi:helix-turn-helix domain-containing protein [Novosphingobium sp.]|uniref:helix-turn-helix domain-containing protein n=1 Tax=Novosphingobium sp. TaxID=1874826 RepID=UPI003D12628C